MSNRTLTERENALRAILRTGEPEWVPVLDDCVEIIFPSAMAEYPPFFQSGEDWFGVHWKWDDASFAHGPDARVPNLVEDIIQWRDIVKLPDLDAIDWKAAAERDLAGKDRENKLIRLFCTIGPFERMNFILGMENAFISMYEEPEEYKAMIEKVTDHKVKLMEKLIEAYQPDEIFFHDDLGSENGPMISPDMYREFIKPCHKRVADTIRSRGVIFTYHSCGHMEVFIEDLIEVGAQMLNPLQDMNNWEMIAEKYSDRVSFNVGAEGRANHFDATEEELRAGCRKVIDIFAPKKNLLVNCYISNMACQHNAAYVLGEAREYGGSFYK